MATSYGPEIARPKFPYAARQKECKRSKNQVGKVHGYLGWFVKKEADLAETRSSPWLVQERRMRIKAADEGTAVVSGRRRWKWGFVFGSLETFCLCVGGIAHVRYA
jgi:hypothetical protein